MTLSPAFDYKPARPPLTARWSEWASLFERSSQQDSPAVAEQALRQARASAGPVLVLPALARGDGQTLQLRRHLAGQGFDARGWGLGVDIGPSRRTLERLEALLCTSASREFPINLVGLSMGGLLARWVAQRRPELVRQIITVGSPFRSPLDSFFLPLRPVVPLWPGDVDAFIEAVSRRPCVPSTCLYTVTDGTVAWLSCLDPDRPADCFEFRGTHMTMARNPVVWSLIEARLGR